MRKKGREYQRRKRQRAVQTTRNVVETMTKQDDTLVPEPSPEPQGLVSGDATRGSTPGLLQTDGDDAAKGYAVGDIATGTLTPTLEMDTVVVVDPAWVPAPASLAKQGSGP